MHCLRFTYIRIFCLDSNTVFAELPAFLRFNIHRRHRSKLPKLPYKPDPHKITSDYIGPVDPVSNLPHYVRHIPKNETPLHKRFREMQIDVENWNHEFWRNHNSSFYREKEEFIKKHNLTGDEPDYQDRLSVFYKRFLDDNYKRHWDYNWSWYRKNYTLLWLAFRVEIERIYRKVRGLDKK